jgi:hypothetical protein
MAKKARKVLKQESQQRAIQQAVANVNTVSAAASAPAETAVSAAPAPARVVKGVSDEQEFAFVKSDVRRSLTLAGLFAVVMIVLSFVVR